MGCSRVGCERNWLARRVIALSNIAKAGGREQCERLIATYTSLVFWEGTDNVSAVRIIAKQFFSRYGRNANGRIGAELKSEDAGVFLSWCLGEEND